MASTTIIDSYRVGMQNAKIKLKVTIENAQIAKSTVRLNKKNIGEYQDSFEIELGNATDLWGVTLYVDTTETDVNPDSNKTSFNLELNGGTLPYFNRREQSVNPSGYVLYTAEITIIP